MKKENFKIGDIAKELNIKKSLIRQWEAEFSLYTRGQTCYSVEDMKVFVHIKELVRTKGLPVDQAKIELQKLPEFKTIPAKKMDLPKLENPKMEFPQEEPKLLVPPKKTVSDQLITDFKEQLLSFKENLLKLKKLLN